MIRLPLRDSFQPIFIIFNEDPHEGSFRIFCGEHDISDLCSSMVLEECRQEVLLYHSGIERGRNEDQAYEEWRDDRDMA